MVRPIEIWYRPVFHFEYDAPVAYMSELRIVDPNMGVLTPDMYLPVAQRSVQCQELFKFNFDKVAEDAAFLKKKGMDFEWITVYTPVRAFLDEDLREFVRTHTEDKGIEAGLICLCLPMEVLYEKPSDVNARLAQLKELGVTVMVSDFGGEYCPTVRLAAYHFDVALLDGYVMRCLGAVDEKGESDDNMVSIALSILEFVKAREMEVVLTGVDSAQQAKFASDKGIPVSVGNFAGKFRKLSAIK